MSIQKYSDTLNRPFRVLMPLTYICVYSYVYVYIGNQLRNQFCGTNLVKSLQQADIVAYKISHFIENY